MAEAIGHERGGRVSYRGNKRRGIDNEGREESEERRTGGPRLPVMPLELRFNGHVLLRANAALSDLDSASVTPCVKGRGEAEEANPKRAIWTHALPPRNDFIRQKERGLLKRGTSMRRKARDLR